MASVSGQDDCSTTINNNVCNGNGCTKLADFSIYTRSCASDACTEAECCCNCIDGGALCPGSTTSPTASPTNEKKSKSKGKGKKGKSEGKDKDKDKKGKFKFKENVGPGKSKSGRHKSKSKSKSKGERGNI